MTDDFEDSLREALANAVPTPPEEPHRAAGARAYTHRVRRTRAVIAVGAVAVVAAAAIVVPSVLASPNSDVAGPGPRNPVTGTPPQGGPACPAATAAVKPTDVPAVPVNAVAARLCVWATDGPVWSPREPLVTGLDDLARTLNALPPASTHGCIPAGSLPVYQLVLRYADGQRVVVTGDLGCGYVGIGSSLREGAEDILQSYLGRIADQRQSYLPPTSTAPAASCMQGAGLSSADPFVVDGQALALQAAHVCSVSNYIGRQERQAGLLTPSEIAILNADFAQNRSRTRPKDPRVTACLSVRGGGIPTYEIIGTSTWGDQVRLNGTCLLFSYTDRSGHWYWVPSSDVADMLSAALHTTGLVTGRLEGVGGMAPGVAFSWPGTIALRSAGAVYHASAGDDGRFDVSVPPGRYRVVGHSPSYNDGEAACNPLRPFVIVRSHETVRVNVFCQMK